MEQQEKEKNAEKAFKIHQDIIEREKQRRKLFGLNVLDLVIMYGKDFYKLILGEGAEAKWNGYLSDIEIYYSRSKIERWRRIIEKLIQQFGLEIDTFIDIPETRLEGVVDIIKAREKDKKEVILEDVEKLLHMAREMISLDWNNIVKKERGKITTEECEHKKMDVYRICKVCGFRIKQNIGTGKIDESND